MRIRLLWLGLSIFSSFGNVRLAWPISMFLDCTHALNKTCCAYTSALLKVVNISTVNVRSEIYKTSWRETTAVIPNCIGGLRGGVQIVIFKWKWEQWLVYDLNQNTLDSGAQMDTCICYIDDQYTRE